MTRAGDPVSRGAGERPTLRTLVIIPTFNERENLPLIVQRLRTALPEVHVLVVDDNSPDGTGQLAEDLASANPGLVHVMHRTVKDGLGAAYLAGFAWGLAGDTPRWLRWTPTAATHPNSCICCSRPSIAAPTW